ncbi:MAG: rsmB [Haloplasmataceae bacterium]|jgi:16S rRNA (cytosine967-C5)-methyltransferase|nr:rsmB [Haloplasmataceae bacterium]
MKNVREVALNIIDKVLNEEGYSNLLISQSIFNNEVNDKDSGLLTELVYGTIQYKLTLDYYLADFIGERKIKHSIRNILRMSMYQLKYLDRIPQHAIINEAVNLAKMEHQIAANYVNAVLRNVIKSGVKSLESIENEEERLSIKTSHPLWLIKLWKKQYDFETAKSICEMNNIRPFQYARLNLFKDKRENILNRLNELKIEYNQVENIEEAIYVKNSNLANTGIYKEGFINIQDLSSILVAKILSPVKGENIIDVCAAPGGKSTHIAEMMQNQGSVISCDIYEHKIELIKYNAKRLGLSIIKPMLIDATKLSSKFSEASFDRVLVDAPCSGFGVIKRKPEIKYNKKPQDIDEITGVQKAIVDEAVKLVKLGGTLVYSTCTINKKENEKMVEYILKTYPEYKLNPEPFKRLNLGNEGYIQIINQVKDADLFFIASFKKEN